MTNEWRNEGEFVIDDFAPILDGRSNEELEQICIDLLGDIKENYPNDIFSSYFPGALSKDSDVFELARRIGEERYRRSSEWSPPSSKDRDLVARDFGFAAAYSEPSPFISVVKRGLLKEVRSITSTLLMREEVDPEEIKRRVKVLHMLADNDALSIFARKSIPSDFYGDSIDDFEKDCLEYDQRRGYEPGYTKLSTLQSTLPNFLQVVSSFLEQGIDLEEIKMEHGISLMEAYQRIKNRFGEYIRGNEIVDPSMEKGVDIQDSPEQDDVSISEEVEEENNEIREMVNRPDDENAEDIQSRIEENNQQILELMAENAKLTATLVELSQKEQSNHQVFQ